MYTCRILKKLAMYQIGRNFYKPSEPVEIPQHKYVYLYFLLPWNCYNVKNVIYDAILHIMPSCERLCVMKNKDF